MAAYNRINGIYACSNAQLLGQVLKDEWGFEGLVMSDWFAAKETVDNALGHLDLEMPGPSQVWGDSLRAAVDSGQVPEALIDDKVRRLLRVLDWSGRFKQPEEHPEQSIDQVAHRQVAYQTAIEGMVLLKNTGFAAPGSTANSKTRSHRPKRRALSSHGWWVLIVKAALSQYTTCGARRAISRHGGRVSKWLSNL